MAEPFPFPEISLQPAACLSVDDASLQVKYEETLSTESPSTTCPVQSVTLSSMQLHNTYIPAEHNPTSRYTDRHDWEVLVGNTVSGRSRIPQERKFQLWKGSLLRIAGDPSVGTSSDEFVPLTENGLDIRSDWLTISESSTRTEWDGAQTFHVPTQGTFLQAMRNSITRSYEIEQVRDTGRNMVSQAPLGSPGYDLEKYTLNCSALIPENFSAYRGQRAPIIILNSDFDLSDTNRVANYRGPVKWITPSASASATRGR
ncbi:hypothetical protein L486_05227 [Kwoniella mangroviensis CBS 10435]|uniref:Uncharacterized protein n=1 Tax=Kwoniella mangroviensis CBS 10435 TaxID=1331196 RepID=A0A1B9IQE9_9TREE|nr:hypothetical protein L486_05227 [Kwoniella mangroviensis CBS 10435]